MDKFERQFEDVDVQTQYLEGTVSAVTAVSTPSDEVSRLLRQVADVHQLTLNEGMTSTPNDALFTSIAGRQHQDSLDERLAKLRSMNS